MNLQAKLGQTDRDKILESLSKDKEHLAKIIAEKDSVIEKKEKLISEYKRDLERERREKAD